MLGMFGLSAGGVSAVTKWATPDDWYASSAGDKSNDPAFWEAWFDLNEGDCWKIEGEGLGAVQNPDGSASLGVAYGEVIVKQANPHAKNVTFDNTIFDDVAADETVFADTDGNGVYNADDSNGISHIIVCSPSQTTTTSSSTTTSESATTTSESATTTSESATTTSESATTTSESATTTSESATTTSESATTTSESATTTSESATTTSESATTTSESASTTTTFTGGTGGETDVPTQPNTAAVGTGGPSHPSNNAWMLILALGGLLTSVVLLTPAGAKSKR
jgi:hypothetical protein